MTLTNTGGILQPILAHRFRVLFDHKLHSFNPITDTRLLLTQQVVETSLDLLHNIFKIKLRQPVTPNLFTHLINLTENPNFTQTIVIEPMDSSETLWSLHLIACKCISHECNFSYIDNDLLYHNMTYKYRNAKITSPVDWDHILGKDSIPPKENTISPEEAVQKIEEASEE